METSDETHWIREIAKTQYKTVEKNIAEAARSGYMIALDEFLGNGTWNRKFLKRTHLIGAYSSSGDLIGQGMFGPSAICRTESLVMGCYILVDSERKYQGLEEVMVENMIEIARKLEFEGILFDVYRTETKFVALLLDMGFKVTGSLPECGYMKDAGYVDSLLLYKEFTVGSSKL